MKTFIAEVLTPLTSAVYAKICLALGLIVAIPVTLQEAAHEFAAGAIRGLGVLAITSLPLLVRWWNKRRGKSNQSSL